MVSFALVVKTSCSVNIFKMEVLNFFLLITLFLGGCSCQIGNCGTAGAPTGLVFNGTLSKKGQWPWLVAVYSIDSDQYFCGGTLISSRFVSTVSKSTSLIGMLKSKAKNNF